MRTTKEEKGGTRDIKLLDLEIERERERERGERERERESGTKERVDLDREKKNWPRAFVILKSSS